MKDYERQTLIGDLGFYLETVKNPSMPKEIVRLYGQRIELRERELMIPEMVALTVSRTAELVPLQIPDELLLEPIAA